MINKSFIKSIVTILMLSVFLLLAAFQRITPLPSGPDWKDNALIAYHLAKTGDFALEDERNSNKLYPTNFREPLPIFIWAIAANMNGNLLENKFESFVSSGGLLAMKKANLLILMLLFFATFLLLELIPPGLISGLEKTMLFIFLAFTYQAYGLVGGVNQISSDIHSATLMLLFISGLLVYFRQPSLMKAGVAGLVYALLCLTKAAFFYVGFVLFASALLSSLYSKYFVLRHVLVSFLTMLLIVSPWLVRNGCALQQFSISGRGGETMMDRKFEEIYNEQHLSGMFYAYSPDFLKPVMSRLTGYTFRDRLPGGRLQHTTRDYGWELKARDALQMDAVINSHHKASVFIRKIYNHFYEAYKSPVLARKYAEQQYKKFVFEEALHHPVRHLKFGLLFAWRGLWVTNYVDGRAYEVFGVKRGWIKELLPAVGFFSLIIITAYGLVKRSPILIAITATPISVYCFYFLFTHNIPRYSLHLLPVWCLSLGLLLLWIKNKLKLFLSNR
ncbi:hypothetical protein [Methylophilus aquaticus]|uniref:Glycosyltransferase RgtA/B/C/D-like domain-containing protein n=1 Tax=Methylophilus aquaticus TaxID=1971610 RepID=A0ABT9JP64_9PROT|nr:hypothetical protein [Methylophilus aquaticus]MDP8566371.1 hypothetical protein [Methylophilus aquaticus]